MSSVVIPSMGTIVEKEINITHTLFGLSLGMTMAGLTIGYLLFIVPARPGWLAGLTRAGIAALIFANIASVIPSFWAVSVGRFAVGFAVACGVMSVSLFVVQFYSGYQDRLFCLIHACVLLGTALGMYLTPLVFRLSGQWRPFALLLAGVSGVLFTASFFGPINITVEKRSSFLSSFFRCVCHRQIFLIIILLSAYLVVENSVSCFFAVCAENEKGLPLEKATSAVALFLLGLMAGRFIVSAWLRRKPTVRGITILTLAGCLLLFIALLTRGYPATAGALFLTGLCFGPVYPLGITHAIALKTDQNDIILSAINVIANLAFIFGSVAVGKIGDVFSIHLGIGVFCFVLAASAALLALAGRDVPE